MADELREAAEAVELRAEPGVIRPVAGEAGRAGCAARACCGLRSSSWLSWMPIWCSVDVLRFSTNTSDCSTRRISSSRPRDGADRACTTACSGRSSCSSRDGCTAGPPTPSAARRVHREEAAEQHRRARPRQVALGGRREHRRVLDPDHLGAEVGEQLGEVRARPHRGEVEDPDPAAAVARSGSVAGSGAVAGRARLGTAAAPLASVLGRRDRRGTVMLPATLRVPVRGPGQQHGPDASGRRTSAQNPRWWRWSASSTSAGEYTPANGQPAACAAAVPSARVCSNNHGYSTESRISLVSGFPNASGRANALAEGVVVQHREHLVELLRCRHHRHVAVGAREDPGGEQGVDRVGRELQGFVPPVLPAEVPAHARGNGSRGPRRPRSRRARPHRSARARSDAGQRAERSGVTDRAEGDDTWGLHRHLERSTLGEGRPRRDLRHQVRPPVRGVRAGGPEAADGRDDQRRMLRAQLVARDTEALQVAHAVALDHHVAPTPGAP